MKGDITSHGSDKNAQGDCVPSGLTEARMRLLRRSLRDGIAQIPAHERPKAILVSPLPFTVAGGEITSNLKLRRKSIEAKFQTAIDDAYARMKLATKQSPDGDDSLLIVECR